MPHGVSITNAVNGVGKRYFKVRLGKKFTGAEPVVKNFGTLEQARGWIFGTRQSAKGDALAQGMIELKCVAGAIGFAFTPAQLGEAAWAFQTLQGASLVQAVKFFVARTRPNGGGKRLSEFDR